MLNVLFSERINIIGRLHTVAFNESTVEGGVMNEADGLRHTLYVHEGLLTPEHLNSSVEAQRSDVFGKGLSVHLADIVAQVGAVGPHTGGNGVTVYVRIEIYLLLMHQSPELLSEGLFVQQFILHTNTN